MIYLLWHTITRTIPKIFKEHRDDREVAFKAIAEDRERDRLERAADREIYRTELAEIRKSMSCHFLQQQQGGK
jgi:hypothetical protein